MSGPLSINLDTQDTKTAVPVIKDGSTVHVKLKDIKEGKTEKGGTIQFIWELLDPAPTEDGPTLNPGEFGSTFFDTVYLYEKDKPGIPEQAKKKIAARQDALLETGDPGNPKGKPTRQGFNGETAANMIGRSCWAKVKAKKGEFAGNEIQSLISEQDRLEKASA